MRQFTYNMAELQKVKKTTRQKDASKSIRYHLPWIVYCLYAYQMNETWDSLGMRIREPYDVYFKMLFSYYKNQN